MCLCGDTTRERIQASDQHTSSILRWILKSIYWSTSFCLSKIREDGVRLQMQTFDARTIMHLCVNCSVYFIFYLGMLPGICSFTPRVNLNVSISSTGMLVLNCSMDWSTTASRIHLSFHNSRENNRKIDTMITGISTQTQLQLCQNMLQNHHVYKAMNASCRAVNQTLFVNVQFRVLDENDLAIWTCKVTYKKLMNHTIHTIIDSNSYAYDNFALTAFSNTENVKIALDILVLSENYNSITVACAIRGLNRQLFTGNPTSRGCPFKLVIFRIDGMNYIIDIFGRNSIWQETVCSDASLEVIQLCNLTAGIIATITFNEIHRFSCLAFNTASRTRILPPKNFPVLRQTNHRHQIELTMGCENVRLGYRMWTNIPEVIYRSKKMIVDYMTFAIVHSYIKCNNGEFLPALDIWENYKMRNCHAQHDYGIAISQLNETHAKCSVLSKISHYCPKIMKLIFQNSQCFTWNCQSSNDKIVLVSKLQSHGILSSANYRCAIQLSNSSVIHIRGPLMSAKPRLSYQVQENGHGNLICTCDPFECQKLIIHAHQIDQQTHLIVSNTLFNITFSNKNGRIVPWAQNNVFSFQAKKLDLHLEIRRDFFTQLTDYGRKGVVILAHCISRNESSSIIELMYGLAKAYERDGKDTSQHTSSNYCISFLSERVLIHVIIMFICLQMFSQSLSIGCWGWGVYIYI